MRVLQKSKGCNSYIEVSGVEIKDNYERRMLSYADFEWLVKADYRYIDNEESMLFRIDGMSVLSTRFRRVNPGIEDVRSLIRDLGECLDELSEYMLDPEDMVIDTRSILYDNQTARHKFLYVPGSGEGFIKQVKRLLEDVMIIFDDRDKNSVTELYEIYSRLLTDNFSPEMLKELVIQKENPSVHRGGSSSEELYIQGKPSEDVQRYNEKFIMPCPEKYEKTKKEKNKTEETEAGKAENEKTERRRLLMYGAVIALLGVIAMAVLGAKGMILSLLMLGGYTIYAVNEFNERKQNREIEEAMSEYAGAGTVNEYTGASIGNEYVGAGIAKVADPENSLVPMCTEKVKEVSGLIPFAGAGEEPIRLMEDGEMKVGRQSGTCRYCLSEPGISRIHAVIRKEGSKVSLRDENSTNGTYVNNKRLKQDAVELKYGDVVSFAGVEYYCV